MAAAHFFDRHDAGEQLAKAVRHFESKNPVVFALPRGGLPLGVAVAKQLNAPLDLIITRKIGHPYNPEYAIGAISEFGNPIYNPTEIRRVDQKWLQNEEVRLRNEIKRRRLKYAKNVPHIESLVGKTAIIVDDGIATGYTILAAIDDIKQRSPDKIVVAIPVVPESMAQRLEDIVDEVIAIERTRHYLGAVGAYYTQFNQLNDEDVLHYLSQT